MRSKNSTKRVLSAILCTAMIFNPVLTAYAAESDTSTETVSQTDTTEKKYLYNGRVTIEKEPDKLIYFVGEEIDFTGGKVSSKCNLSQSSTVIEKFEHETSDMDINDGIYTYDTSGFDNTQPGTYTIKIGKVTEGENATAETTNNVKAATFTVTVVKDLSKIEKPSVELVFKKAQRKYYDLDKFEDAAYYKPYDNVKFDMTTYIYDYKEDVKFKVSECVRYEVSEGNKINIDLPAEVFRKYNDPQRYYISFFIEPVDLPEGFDFDGDREFSYKGDPDESHNIIVLEREVITNVGSLSISPPDKLVYKIGEELDLTGGRKSGSGAKVSNLSGTMAHWDDFGSDLNMYDIDSSDFDNSKPGEYTIRTDCYDLNAESQKEFTVKVIDSEKPEGAEVVISVVDEETGKNIEGIKVTLYEDNTDPNAVNRVIAMWNTSKNAERSYIETNFDKYRKYLIELDNIPEEYFPSSIFEFAFGSEDEKAEKKICLKKIKTDTEPSEEEAKGPSAKITVIDADTGKNIEGIDVELERGINATGHCDGKWNTSDTAEKNYTSPVFDSRIVYGVYLKNVPEEYAHEDCYSFGFEKNDENAEWTIRLKKRDVQEDTASVIGNEGDLQFRVYGKFKGEYDKTADIGSVEIRNDSNELLGTIEPGKKFSLPDGEYSSAMHLKSRANSCFGDEIIKFTVKDGKTETKLDYNVERWDFNEKGNGDSNGDGSVDLADAVLIMQALANPSKYGVKGNDEKHMTEEGYDRADVDGGGVTNMDALTIQKYLLGFFNIK